MSGDRFNIPDRDTFFTNAQRSRMVYETLLRTRYDEADTEKIGPSLPPPPRYHPATQRPHATTLQCPHPHATTLLNNAPTPTLSPCNTTPRPPHYHPATQDPHPHVTTMQHNAPTLTLPTCSTTPPPQCYHPATQCPHATTLQHNAPTLPPCNTMPPCYHPVTQHPHPHTTTL